MKPSKTQQQLKTARIAKNLAKMQARVESFRQELTSQGILNGSSTTTTRGICNETQEDESLGRGTETEKREDEIISEVEE